MRTYYDSKGQPYVLTDRVGTGGEGSVYSISGDAQTVAKIYHEPITEEKAVKLRWMAENKNEPLLKIAAWIIDTLHDAPEGGKTIGFLMPNIAAAKEIHELYSLKSRRVYFPHATWQFLVHTAANVARAFYALHKYDHVMGDVNHGNCVVLKNGTVKLIDCDSYSISDGTRRYSCEVGVATHLAPELQGKNLRDAERLPAHDNFGLAVIVFQLLFLGRHPFAGNYTGGDDKPLETCIRERLFAYASEAAAKGVRQPPGTLSLSALPARVAEMFERAFLTEGERPEPDEWVEALEDLSHNLKQCGLHPGHFYFEQLAACPWCDIESQTGLMLFPLNEGGDAFNVFTVENLIASISSAAGANQDLLPAVPAKPSVPLPATEEVKDEVALLRRKMFSFGVAQGLIVFFVTVLIGVGVGVTIGILAAFVFIVVLQYFDNDFKELLKSNANLAQQEWKRLEDDRLTASEAARFDGKLRDIRTKLADYQNLQQQSRHKVKLLLDERRQRAVNDYLSSIPLAEAEIPGVKSIYLRNLQIFGIKTAADLNANDVQMIPSVDYATSIKLLDWRKNLEKNYAFDAVTATEVPEAEQNAIFAEATTKRRTLEREIEQMIAVLRSGSLTLRRQQQQLGAKFEAAARRIAQAEGDLKAVGVGIVPMAFFLLALVTIFTAGFGSYLAPSRNNAPYPGVERNRTSTLGSGTTSKSAVNLEEYSVLPEYYVPDDISDETIANLTYNERVRATRTLYDQSVALVAGEKPKFRQAEEKLRLAIRVSGNIHDSSYIFNQLGYVLYEQKKYSESLNFLYESLAKDSRNIGTKTYIGMNYLKMEDYASARQFFEDVTRESKDSYEGFYYLGLAYKGLGDYYSAIYDFRKAEKIYPGDVPSMYEIGVCLHYAGDEIGANTQYRMLLNIDRKSAAQLKEIINDSPPEQMQKKNPEFKIATEN